MRAGALMRQPGRPGWRRRGSPASGTAWKNRLHMKAAKSEAISPTAHYTGYVWARNGLSHPLLATAKGRMLYQALRPAMLGSAALGGPTLESYLLARHLALDALLEQAIAREGVTQVLELACGLSPRGWRFASRHGRRLTYIEADLPAMAALKRRALERMGSLGDQHRVADVDVLRREGPGSIAALLELLDPDAGVAIVVEGLVGYLETEALLGFWRNLVCQLRRFRSAAYLCDLQLGSRAGISVKLFRAVLSGFVGGRVALHHFPDAPSAEHALRQAGFSHASVLAAAPIASARLEGRGRGAALAHVALAQAAAEAG